MVISVIVPVYHGRNSFRALLQSLQALTPSPFEVILVLDGAEADDQLTAANTDFTVVPLPERLGPAGARNVGVRHAQGDLIVFVDADVTVPPTLLAQIAAVFEADSPLAALIGSYDDAPQARNFLSQYKNLQHHFVHQHGNSEAATFWGACGAIKRTTFDAVGGFDENARWNYIEDIELGYRLRAAGHRIRLCPSIQVKHWKAYNWLSLLRSDICYRAVPWSLLILQSGNAINDLNTGTTNRLSIALTGLFFLMLLLGVWQTWLWLAAILCLSTIITLNVSFFMFLCTKRGLWFTIRSIFWQLMYFLYSGVSFAAVLCYWRFLKLVEPPQLTR